MPGPHGRSHMQCALLYVVETVAYRLSDFLEAKLLYELIYSLTHSLRGFFNINLAYNKTALYVKF